ncbi:DUF6916 family protein [Hoeflea olei]|uniref:DUF6916 domain-containing protein n=1 Tax=Hoeflea olei TaxID=1480615 RepID=A0A1C1YTR3_9HYPH|nr:hypothetical protein [Hoeflea olei]OCW56918.1 hypothetical protein AWJ14_07090 [Hoeflea olei]
MSADLTVEHFEPLQDRGFTVISADPAQELRLVEVERKGHGERPGGAFSLLWQSSSGAVLPQGIYTMRNEALGEFGVFIVPVGASEAGVRYEAIFA